MVWTQYFLYSEITMDEIRTKFRHLTPIKKRETTLGQLEILDYLSIGEYWGVYENVKTETSDFVGAPFEQHLISITFQLHPPFTAGLHGDQLEDKSNGNIYQVETIDKERRTTIVTARKYGR